MLNELRKVTLAWPELMRRVRGDMGLAWVVVGVVFAPLLIPFVAFLWWSLGDAMREIEAEAIQQGGQ